MISSTFPIIKYYMRIRQCYMGQLDKPGAWENGIYFIGIVMTKICPIIAEWTYRGLPNNAKLLVVYYDL